jgi:hypothetical protein
MNRKGGACVFVYMEAKITNGCGWAFVATERKKERQEGRGYIM